MDESNLIIPQNAETVVPMARGQGYRGSDDSLD